MNLSLSSGWSLDHCQVVEVLSSGWSLVKWLKSIKTQINYCLYFLDGSAKDVKLSCKLPIGGCLWNKNLTCSEKKTQLQVLAAISIKFGQFCQVWISFPPQKFLCIFILGVQKICKQWTKVKSICSLSKNNVEIDLSQLLIQGWLTWWQLLKIPYHTWKTSDNNWICMC